jgi:hypothetical protein
MAGEVQLLDRLEKLGLAQGASSSIDSSAAQLSQSNTTASTGPSQPQSVDGPTHVDSSDEDDNDDNSTQLKDRSARSLGVARRSSGGSSAVVTAAAAAAHAQAPSALHYYRPHDGFGLGCPAPACFEERVNTAKGIHQKMDLHDGELESTLRLLCKVFDVETATVSLLTGERIYLVGACGALPVSVCCSRVCDLAVRPSAEAGCASTPHAAAAFVLDTPVAVQRGPVISDDKLCLCFHAPAAGVRVPGQVGLLRLELPQPQPRAQRGGKHGGGCTVSLFSS